MRITSFGSSLNDWVNLAEIRWSMLGLNNSSRKYLTNNEAFSLNNLP